MTGSAQGKPTFNTFTGGGEMGELMRSLDWSQTPVGSVQFWPQSLKSLVKTLLTSRYPMVLTWGAEFTQFYNDAYSQLIGDKHPAALGTDIRETLAEAWNTLGPMIQRVMATGVANWTPALPLVLERAGYREESYFSVSHAPAEDDAGQIVGMLAVCSEVTQQVLGERRLRLLRDLAAQTGEIRSVQDTCQNLMTAIAVQPLDVPFALLYLRESDGKTLTLQGAVGLTLDESLCPRSIDLATSHPLWSFDLAAAGETVLVEALDQHIIVPGGLWSEPVHTALMLPIAAGQTATLGVLIAGVNPNRALDESYRSFYELLVGQVAVSIRNAQAYEEERRRLDWVLSSVSDFVYTFDLAGRFTYVNQPLLNLWQKSLDQVIGKTFFELDYPPELADRLQRQIQRVTTTRQPLRDESLYTSVSGTRVYEYIFVPLLDAKGAVEAVAGTTRDLTDHKQTEESLRQSEERYRTLFELIDEGFCVVEVLFDEDNTPIDYRFLEINPAFEQQTGLQHAVGKTVRQLIPNLEDFWVETYGRVALTGEPIRFESGAASLNRWFDVYACRTGQPEDHKVAIVFKDVSDRKRVEDERKRAAEISRRTAELDAFRVSLADALRPLTDASEIQAIAAHILGESLRANRVIYSEVVSDSEEVIVDHNYTHGVAALTGRYRLEDYRRNLTADHQAGQTHVVTNIPDNPRYTDAEKARYRELDIAAHIDVPLIKNNQLVALLAVHQSTPRQWSETEIKRVEETAERTWGAVERARAEAALRQSEARYRLLAEAIPQLVWITDANGHNEYVNQRFCDYTGLTAEQLGGLNWLSILHPDDLAMTHDRWLTAIDTGQFYEIEYRFRATDGSYRWFLGQGIPLIDEQGQIYKWFGTCTDIEPQKQIEQARLQLLKQEQTAREQAETANRIKDEFLAVLSHELRSPLNPILGWTRLLRSGKLDETRQQEALNTIERNAKLQTQLIEDLLDISRIMQGKLSLTAAPVSLTFVITAAVETVRLAAEAKNIEIILDLTPEIASVYGDATRLQQVMWNLLTNAVKFTANGGRIEVKLEQVRTGEQGLETREKSFTSPQPLAPSPSYAQITVADTGKGIKPEFLPYVFEYFRQEDGSTTRKFGGLGLGLAIVRQIVELHGGTIAVASPGEGMGATFTVQIPLASRTRVSPAVEPPSQSSVNLSGVHILVVDDEADSREFVTFVLEQAGAIVTTVGSGLDALQAFSLEMPDIIVSDIGMPEMDGHMLIQQIRALNVQAKQVPAIALTAYAREYDRATAIAAGFQQHIPKPVDSEELVTAICTLCNRSPGSNTL